MTVETSIYSEEIGKITADERILNWICCVLDDAAEYQRMRGYDVVAHEYEKHRKEIDTALQEEDAYYR